MKYQVKDISEKDRWIYISSDDDDMEPDAFILLVKTIQKAVGGKISSAGELRYKISNLPCDIVFQWDDVFGIVIDYGDEDKDTVIKLLQEFGVL